LSTVKTKRRGKGGLPTVLYLGGSPWNGEVAPSANGGGGNGGEQSSPLGTALVGETKEKGVKEL